MDRSEEALGSEVWQRFTAVYEAIDVRHEELTEGPHWDLWVIGVEPASQGKGVGRALLEPVLQRVDQSGETCYLETLDERTLPLYERIGFEVRVAEVEVTSGLPYWCCVRPPRDPGHAR